MGPSNDDASSYDASSYDASVRDGQGVDARQEERDSGLESGAKCGTEQTLCPSGCSDLTRDDKNCGACGKACASTEHCEQSACVSGPPDCAAGTTKCGASCVDTLTDNDHCGSCSNACTASETCISGACTPKPANDDRLGATPLVIDPNGGEITVQGTTIGATASPEVDTECGKFSGRDVWYKVTLNAPRTNKLSLVYADTIGSPSDTYVYFTYSDGTPIRASDWGGGKACSRDACGGSGAQAALHLSDLGQPGGVYYIVVGSQGSPGNFVLHFQTMPFQAGVDFPKIPGYLEGKGSAPVQIQTTKSNLDVSCSGAATVRTGGDAYWFLSCGNDYDLFSVCPGDDGFWETRGNNSLQPILATYVPSASGRVELTQSCSFGVGSCKALDNPSSKDGAYTNTILQRGLNVVTVSDLGGVNDNNPVYLRYSLAHDIKLQ